MEELHFGHVLVLGVFGVVIIDFVGSLLLSGLSVWLEYTFRKPKETYKLGYKWMTKWQVGFMKGLPSPVTTFLLIVCSLCAYKFTEDFIYILVTMALILVGTLGPRFIIDICKATKYNSKSGKCETLEELKAKVKVLEEKV
tara:strand:+ start:673 stop:1095 length:423 start_codon:yes stop_codon:yes gene_type:complete